MRARTKLESICEECLDLSNAGTTSLQGLCHEIQKLGQEIETITSCQLPTLSRAVEQFHEKHLRRPIPINATEVVRSQKHSVGVLLGGIDGLYLQCTELRADFPAAGSRLPSQKSTVTQSYAVGYTPEYVQSRSLFSGVEDSPAIKGLLREPPSPVDNVSTRLSDELATKGAPQPKKPDLDGKAAIPVSPFSTAGAKQSVGPTSFGGRSAPFDGPGSTVKLAAPEGDKVANAAGTDGLLRSLDTADPAKGKDGKDAGAVTGCGPFGAPQGASSPDAKKPSGFGFGLGQATSAAQPAGFGLGFGEKAKEKPASGTPPPSGFGAFAAGGLLGKTAGETKEAGETEKREGASTAFAESKPPATNAFGSFTGSSATKTMEGSPFAAKPASFATKSPNVFGPPKPEKDEKDKESTKSPSPNPSPFGIPTATVKAAEPKSLGFPFAAGGFSPKPNAAPFAAATGLQPGTFGPKPAESAAATSKAGGEEGAADVTSAPARDSAGAVFGTNTTGKPPEATADKPVPSLGGFSLPPTAGLSSAPTSGFAKAPVSAAVAFGKAAPVGSMSPFGTTAAAAAPDKPSSSPAAGFFTTAGAGAAAAPSAPAAFGKAPAPAPAVGGFAFGSTSTGAPTGQFGNGPAASGLAKSAPAASNAAAAADPTRPGAAVAFATPPGGSTATAAPAAAGLFGKASPQPGAAAPAPIFGKLAPTQSSMSPFVSTTAAAGAAFGLGTTSGAATGAATPANNTGMGTSPTPSGAAFPAAGKPTVADAALSNEQAAANQPPTATQAAGQPAATAGAFGQQALQPPSQLGAFGKAPAQSAFGQPPAQPSGFGNAPVQSAFGKAPAQSAFGQPSAQPSGFGNAPAQSAFGKAPPQSAFGQQPPQQQSAFGQQATQPPTQLGAFGKAPAQSAFGQQPPQQQSAFGQPPAQPSGFGSAPVQSAFGKAPAQSAFGQAPLQQSAFGQQPPQQQSAFGNAPVQSAFGKAPAQSAFGQPSAQPSGFGNAPVQSAFGKAPAQSAFGQAPLQQSAFGQSPAGGAAPPQQGFGSVPQNAFSVGGGASVFQRSTISSLAGAYAAPTQNAGVFGSR